jgi:hypothetical protein
MSVQRDQAAGFDDPSEVKLSRHIPSRYRRPRTRGPVGGLFPQAGVRGNLSVHAIDPE